jgi:NHL repeat
LYVLSGSTATITEFDANADVVSSLSGLGADPKGFDVDTLGNIYVAMTSSNQVWKFISTNGAYMADTNFGNGGFIGATNGATGTTNGQFSAPFGVAVSPDGGTISVSDSGNDRIQQFSTSDGSFIAAFGTNGTDAEDFNTPEGLVYDSSGSLYIVDSGNSRIAFDQYLETFGVSGTNGTALGEFNSPVNINVNQRAVYVADAGNNRIQSFSLPAPDSLFSIDASSIRFAVSSGLNEPAAVAGVYNLTNEMFYVADTGNNRILLYSLIPDDPMVAWSGMTNSVTAGNISAALTHFSSASVDDYQQAWNILGTSDVISDVSQIGPLTPIFIKDETAKYYFEQTIDGQPLIFPVEFIKENGVWKIQEF